MSSSGEKRRARSPSCLVRGPLRVRRRAETRDVVAAEHGEHVAQAALASVAATRAKTQPTEREIDVVERDDQVAREIGSGSSSTAAATLAPDAFIQVSGTAVRPPRQRAGTPQRPKKRSSSSATSISRASARTARAPML